jgi:ubiquitin C-terminal hydrolase
MRKIKSHVGYPREIELGEGVRYVLKGVVVHWGSLEHGHYIGVVEREGRWFYCNDKSVNECDVKIALS